MKKLVLVVSALTALVAASLVGVAPTSAATSPKAYTIIDNGDGTCDLATLDLGTGLLTDLPAASSSEACVEDLAANSQGAVWGISNIPVIIGSTPAAVGSNVQVVSFSADGTPSSNRVFVDDTITSVNAVGIAFDPLLGTLLTFSVGGTNPDCPAAGGTCLFSYDPETGFATAIGGSGTGATAYRYLTSCASGALTMSEPDGQVLDDVDTATGAVTTDTVVRTIIDGYDCSPGGSTLYAIEDGALALAGNGASALSATVGTLDSSGNYTQLADVSNPDAEIITLAVVDAAPAPTTTTTTAPAAVAADTVTPAFTG